MQIIPHLAALWCVLTMQKSATSACVQNRAKALFVLTSTYCMRACFQRKQITLHYFISQLFSLWKIVQFMFYIRGKMRAECILMGLYWELKLIEKINFINGFFRPFALGLPLCYFLSLILCCSLCNDVILNKNYIRRSYWCMNSSML